MCVQVYLGSFLTRFFLFAVGKPIPVPALEEGQEPTQEQLLEVQKLYIDELQSIYDKYKDVYAPDRKRELRITD